MNRSSRPDAKFEIVSSRSLSNKFSDEEEFKSCQSDEEYDINAPLLSTIVRASRKKRLEDKTKRI